MITLDVFDCLKSSVSKEETLDTIVEMIRSDAEIAHLTKEVQELSASYGKPATKTLRLTQVPVFAPCASFMDGKSRKNLVSLTGICLLDLDYLTPAQMEQTLEMLKSDEHILLMARSISGAGLHVLVKYSLASEDAYRQLAQDRRQIRLAYASVWKGVCRHYTAENHLPGIDTKASNVERLILLASDPDVYYNPGATPIVFRYRHNNHKKTSMCPAFDEWESGMVFSDYTDWMYQETMAPCNTKVWPLYWGNDYHTVVALSGAHCWFIVLPAGENNLDHYHVCISGSENAFRRLFEVETHKQIVSRFVTQYADENGLDRLLVLTKGKKGFRTEDYRLTESSSELDRYIVDLSQKRNPSLSLLFFMTWYKNMTFLLKRDGLIDSEILSLFRREPLPLLWIKNHGCGISQSDVAKKYQQKFRDMQRDGQEESEIMV